MLAEPADYVKQTTRTKFSERGFSYSSGGMTVSGTRGIDYFGVPSLFISFSPLLEVGPYTQLGVWGAL